ncbi:MAG TPA: hypothetical protein PKO06_05820 [Candidatus Ozemobacteraceae bacterium]|nr:hypothetical protein [Candidatus Ozemobacteraceae bacterium]
MPTNSLKLSCVVLFFALASLVAIAQPAPEIRGALPESLMALPADGSIKTRWVQPPNPELAETVRQNSPARGGPEFTFSVDASGNPWIGVDGRRLLCPAKGFRATLSEPWQTFVHLDQGALLLATVRHLGFPALDSQAKSDKDGWPVVAFQPITPLPNYYSRLYKGANDCLYLVSGHATTVKSTLYLLQPETATTGTATGKTVVSRYKKLIETEEPITAVAGDGATTVIAFGRLVVALDAMAGPIFPWPTQPDGEVRELAFLRNVGVFYTTANSVGYLGTKRGFRLLQTPSPMISLAKNSLYVFFPKNYGVMALDNISDLRTSDLP